MNATRRPVAVRRRSRPRPAVILNELTRAANAGRPPDELLARGLDLMLRVTGLRAGIACACAKGEEQPAVVGIRGLRPAAARALEAGLSLAVPTDPLRFDLAHLPVPPAARAILAAEGITSGVVVPLVSERGPTGVLVGLARGGGALRGSGEVLGAISRELGGAVGNAQVRQGLQSANADLLRLLTLVKILAEPRSLEDTLTTVAQAARSFARAATVSVWLANVAARRLHRIVALEPPGAWRAERRRSIGYGEGAVGRVAEGERALYAHDAIDDPRLGDVEWARERRVTSLYAFPLRFLDRLVGVLSVGTARRLSSAHLSLLEAYSDHAALAIGQADLRRQLET